MNLLWGQKRISNISKHLEDYTEATWKKKLAFRGLIRLAALARQPHKSSFISHTFFLLKDCNNVRHDSLAVAE